MSHVRLDNFNHISCENLKKILSLTLDCLEISEQSMEGFVMFNSIVTINTYPWLLKIQKNGEFYKWSKNKILSLPSHKKIKMLSPWIGEGSLTFCNLFYLSYFLIVCQNIPSYQKIILFYINAKFPVCVSARPILRGFKYLTKRFFFDIFGIYCFDHPVVKINNRTIERYFTIKRQIPGLTGSIPINIKTENEGNINKRLAGLINLNDRLIDINKHEIALIDALKRLSDGKPSGNPIRWMIYSLLYTSLRKCASCVLPLPENSRHGISRDIFSGILMRNILSCSIQIPILTKKLYKCFLNVKEIPRAVICNDCGHCLNLGKCTMKRTNFKPIQLFYCRDQKEKHLLICGTTGRSYCSYCGSTDLRVIQLVNIDSFGMYVVGIILNNAAYTIQDTGNMFDIILPCLSENRTCFTTVTHRVTGRDLIYLTTSPNNLNSIPLCQRCKHNNFTHGRKNDVLYTCLDLISDSFLDKPLSVDKEICAGCVLQTYNEPVC